MCPSYQLKRMFFDILRDRVAQLYSQKAKRSTQRAFHVSVVTKP